MNYFTDMFNRKLFSPGTFWCIFSCVRSYILVQSKIDIKKYMLLRKLIKSLTMTHLAKKAGVFTAEEMKRVLYDFYDESDPKQLVSKVAVALLYYGLLRRCESLQIQLMDIEMGLTDDIDVNFPYKTKRSARGFSFKVPEWLKPTFRKYVAQFPENPHTEGKPTRFLRNWTNSKDGLGRKQNMGCNRISLLAKEIAVYLGKPDVSKFTAHSFRRSGGTALAEAGISVVGLCHAGRWASLKTAQEYQEHTGLEKMERVDMLDGQNSPEKRQRIAPNTAVQSTSAPDGTPSVVQGNFTYIRIEGGGSGNYSFLNGELPSKVIAVVPDPKNE